MKLTSMVFVAISYTLVCSFTLADTPSGKKLLSFTDASANLGTDPSPPGTDSIGLATADVDDDGDNDLFVAEGTAGIDGRQNKLLLNDGNGQFTDVSTSHLPNVLNNSAGVDFGDIDADGDLDIFVANVGPNQLLINNGSGIFEDASTTHLPPPLTLFEDISAQAIFYDIDGDGDLDVFVCNEIPFPNPPVNGAQNRLLINDGHGHFTDQTTNRLPIAIDQSSNVRFGDINNDGFVDAIVSNSGQNTVLINNEDGYFSDETTTRLPAQSDSSRSLALDDVDGDGDLDIFFSNSRGEQDRLYLNNGTGQFTDVTATHLPNLPITSTSVNLADFDCDGDLDAYVTSLTTGSFHNLIGAPNRYLSNTGKGRFIDITHLVMPDNINVSFDADIADLNNDGLLDIVVANAVDEQETLFLNSLQKMQKHELNKSWIQVLNNKCN